MTKISANDVRRAAEYGPDVPISDWPEPPDDPDLRRIWDAGHMSREAWNAKYPALHGLLAVKW